MSDSLASIMPARASRPYGRYPSEESDCAGPADVHRTCEVTDQPCAKQQETTAVCWGSQIAADSTKCCLGFVPGKAHFKNKFCSQCREHGIQIPADRLMLANKFTMKSNDSKPGFWSYAEGVGSFRLINQTDGCRGPTVILLKETSGARMKNMDPLPAAMLTLTSCGLAKLLVSQGTLVPVLAGPVRTNSVDSVGSSSSTASTKTSSTKRKRPLTIDSDITEAGGADSKVMKQCSLPIIEHSSSIGFEFLPIDSQSATSKMTFSQMEDNYEWLDETNWQANWQAELNFWQPLPRFVAHM